jgi:fructuronate reductase
VGVEIVADVGRYRRLKLHVLNAAHSALAYLGLARGHVYVREAIADPELASFLDDLMASEIAPALRDLPVLANWAGVRRRFANPAVDHRLDQIAQDGAQKLAQRVFPLMAGNAARGLPLVRLSRIVGGWIDWTERTTGARPKLQDPSIFPADLRQSVLVQAALQDQAS